MNPWVALLLLLGVLALAGGAYVKGRTDGSAIERATQAKAVAALQKANEEKDRDYRAQSQLLDAANHQIGGLLAYRASSKGLTREVATRAPVTSCPDRSDLYWLQYNEIAAGRAPAIPSPLVPTPAPPDRVVQPPRGLEDGESGGQSGHGAALQSARRGDDR